MASRPGALIARVDPCDHLLPCPRCSRQVRPIFSEAGPHIKASCPVCKEYIKFARQLLSPTERSYWDSYKKGQ